MIAVAGARQVPGKKRPEVSGKYLCSIRSVYHAISLERRFGRKRLERERFRSIEEEEGCFSFSRNRCRLDRDDRFD